MCTCEKQCGTDNYINAQITYKLILIVQPQHGYYDRDKYNVGSFKYNFLSVLLRLIM